MCPNCFIIYPCYHFILFTYFAYYLFIIYILLFEFFNYLIHLLIRGPIQPVGSPFRRFLNPEMEPVEGISQHLNLYL